MRESTFSLDNVKLNWDAMRRIDGSTLAKDLVLSYPFEMDEAWDRLRESLEVFPEQGLTEVEFLLRRFEAPARKLLEANGYDADPAEIWWEEDTDLGFRLAAAKHVLSFTGVVRECVDKGEADLAAIYMMFVTAAAISVDFLEMIAHGAVAEGAVRRGARKSAHVRSHEKAFRNGKIVEGAAKLLKEGKHQKEICALLGERFDLTPRSIRNILQKHGILEKRGN